MLLSMVYDSLADMVKLAYTQDLGSCEETHAGSSPAIRNQAAEWAMRGKNNQPSFVGRGA